MKAGDVRVIFMGSPAFAVPSLRAIHAAGYQVVAVVTQPDRPAGRGGKVTMPEVKSAALSLGLRVMQPETLKDETVRDELRGLDADLTVVAAYGKILSRTVLAIPKRGSINVHASLLPRWRGASPIGAAILAGDAETGVSIMEMAFELDAGPVISQARTAIRPDHTTGTLEAELAELGASALTETLPAWLDGRLKAVPQDDGAATFCGLVRKDDGHLQGHMSAAEAARAVRAYNPWPAAFVSYRDQRLAIWQAHEAAVPTGTDPGSLLVIEKRPAVAFRDGALVLDEVQRPGARRMSGEAFMNGERGNLPDRVGLG